MFGFVEEHAHITVAKSGERHKCLGGKSLLQDTDYYVKAFKIEKDYTICNYGGEREWLVCPQCNKRRLTLYFVGNSLKCRSCACLIYYKQADSKLGRTMTQAIYDYNLYRVKADNIRRPFYNEKLTKRASNILKKLYQGKKAISLLYSNSIEVENKIYDEIKKLQRK
jgi:hypothetical protein